MADNTKKLNPVFGFRLPIIEQDRFHKLATLRKESNKDFMVDLLDMLECPKNDTVDNALTLKDITDSLEEQKNDIISSITKEINNPAKDLEAIKKFEDKQK